jgi:hypothetical protein
VSRCTARPRFATTIISATPEVKLSTHKKKSKAPKMTIDEQKVAAQTAKKMATSLRAGNHQEAIDIFLRAQQSGVFLDSRCWTVLLAAVRATGDVSKLRQTFEDLRGLERPIDLRASHFNILLEQDAADHDSSQFSKDLAIMKSYNVKPDIHTWNVMLRFYLVGMKNVTLEAREQKVNETLGEIYKANFHPDTESYGLLVKHFVAHRTPEEVGQLLQDVADNNAKLADESKFTLLGYFGEMKDITNANAVYEDLLSRKKKVPTALIRPLVPLWVSSKNAAKLLQTRNHLLNADIYNQKAEKVIKLVHKIDGLVMR